MGEPEASGTPFGAGKALGEPETAPEAPRSIDVEAVTGYCRNLCGLLEHASPRERKKLLRLVVEGIKLAPERQLVEINYRAPGHFVNVVAGALFEAVHKVLGKNLRRLIHLPKNGRRPGTGK